MTTDRLAALRAQRQVTAGAIQSIDHGHEHSAIPTFLSEITTIQEGVERINANVTRISSLHSQSLNALDGGSHANATELDALTEETRALTNELKEQIKALETSSSLGKDAAMRKGQVDLVRSKYLGAIRSYKKVEVQYQTKTRERVRRQFKIVKPDATSEEVSAVVDGGGNQIFVQGLTSPQYGESRAAYQEVRERQEDIRKMEQTLAELSQLFIDMGVLVEQQDVTISSINNTAIKIEEDTEAALKETTKATVIGHALRRKKWICFWIFIFVVVVIGVGIGIKIGVDGGLK